MSQTYFNVSEVPLSLAIFLATDNYDYSGESHTISATTLLKPLRQIILAARVPAEAALMDLTQTVPSRVGSAIHDGIERAWLNNHHRAMTSLGFPEKVISRVLVNPTPADLYDGCIPVYLEQRGYRKLGKWTISGKFDFVAEGRVEDFKTTSVYKAILRNSDDDYIMQGSIYRWLNPSLITQDTMAINFIFTDWSAVQARSEPKYPQRRYLHRTFDLLPLNKTEAFVRTKLADIDKYWDAPEDTIPYCTDEELWRSAPVFKYYKNPEKTARSTKNFDTLQEASVRLAQDGHVGIIREQPGQVKACLYCPAFPVCTQKDALIASGDLIV